LPDVEAAARALGRQIVVVKAGDEHEIDAAFAKIVQAGAEALIVGGGPLFTSQREAIVALAARHAMPAIYDLREYVAAGGLISYAASLTGAYRQAGVYAGRGRQAVGAAGPAADHVRAGDQSQDRQGARPHGAADHANDCRRGDRIAVQPRTSFAAARQDAIGRKSTYRGKFAMSALRAEADFARVIA
jgi:hypothetical protein